MKSETVILARAGKGLTAFRKSQRLFEVETVRVDDHPVPPGGDPGHAEGEFVFFLEFGFFTQQQAGQGASDITKTEQSQAGMIACSISRV